MTPPDAPMLELLLDLARLAREAVTRWRGQVPPADRAAVAARAGSDIIYALDRAVEEPLVAEIHRRAVALGGLVLVAEGIGEEEMTRYPANRADADCAWRVLLDPVDGTRGLMMDKRSAWFLAGAAPNRGSATRLRDLNCAVISELPTSRAGFAEIYSLCPGRGLRASRLPLLTSDPPQSFVPAPFDGLSLRGGFGQISRFTPPGREVLAALEERLLERLFPGAVDGEVLCFEDQYLCTGGQWVELMNGRDRFGADLRAALHASPAFAGRRKGHVCHPYDFAGLRVAESAGVILTDAAGNPLDGPLDTLTPLNWIGYANPRLRAEIEPHLLDLLQTEGWGTDTD